MGTDLQSWGSPLPVKGTDLRASEPTCMRTHLEPVAEAGPEVERHHGRDRDADHGPEGTDADGVPLRWPEVHAVERADDHGHGEHDRDASQELDDAVRLVLHGRVPGF